MFDKGFYYLLVRRYLKYYRQCNFFNLLIFVVYVYIGVFINCDIVYIFLEMFVFIYEFDGNFIWGFLNWFIGFFFVLNIIYGFSQSVFIMVKCYFILWFELCI